MEKGFPRFHILDEWPVAHDLLCVQLVEVAFNRRQRHSGAEHAVRVVFSDQDGDERGSIVLCLPAAMELASGISDALRREEAKSGRD